MSDPTYVYANSDGHVEVELTGRRAKKSLNAIGRAESREDILVEIKPSNLEDGRWKKFVRFEELNEIFEE